MARKKREYPLDGKTIFGLSTMTWMNTAGSSFMTSLFMMYMTDYSGLGAFAATLGTVLLFAGRILDAVDDPIQGYLMDRAKPGKYGKYKPFTFAGILLIAVAVIALFSVPSFGGSIPMVSAYVLIFYLMFEIGMSFQADNPIKQSMSNDAVVREKMMSIPRIVGLLVAIPFGFFIPIATTLNKSINNMHTSFMMLTVILVVPICLISLLGLACVKEGKHKETATDEKLSFRDIVQMFKVNKALCVHGLATLFYGFVYNLIFATCTYYIKWAYGCEMVNGVAVLNEDKFALLTTIVGAFQILASMAGAFAAPVITQKLTKDPRKTLQFSLILAVVSGVAMYLLQIVGLLEQSAVLFMVLLFIILFASSLTFVPNGVLWLESMDYGTYKTGKQTSGIVNSVSKFLEKGQAAISQASLGIVLIAAGYVVNEVTGDLAETVNRAAMLDNFMLVSALVPAVLSLIAYLIYRAYPINDTIRAEIRAVLGDAE